MISRRIRLLGQLGITTYQLRRADRLKGECAVRLSAATRLILVICTDDKIPPRFLGDILRAMRLTQPELMIIWQEQLKMLAQPLPCTLWFAGVAVIDLPAAQKLISPALHTLQHSAAAKRDFWQQITATYE